MRRYGTQEIRDFVAQRRAGAGPAPAHAPARPRISIVTPSFNQAQFLERTILSVLNQNYPDLEYLIIDGGSSDGSVEIIKQYERWLAYWVSERDAGQSDALNKGFARATGDLIGWQNSDDIYLPGVFDEAAELFRTHPAVDVAFANRLDIDEQDEVTGESRFTPFSVVVHWYDGMSLSNQSAFWRRGLFARVGMIDPSYEVAMDYEFFLRAALKGARFKHARRYWGASRRHGCSKESTIFSTVLPPECHRIDRTYGRRTVWNIPLKAYSLVRRGLYYLSQGDWDYLAQGLTRRLGLS